MREVLILLIRFYRRFLSPLKPRTCRFHPTCSAYALEALERHGAFWGSYLAVRRVLRCDAEGAALLTSKGTLELTGAELSITSLDLDKGEVKLAGRVDTLEYTAEHTPGGFLRRLVR